MYNDFILVDKMVTIFALIAEEGYLNKIVADFPNKRHHDASLARTIFRKTNIFSSMIYKSKNLYEVSSRLDNSKLGIKIEVQYP